MNKNMFWIFAVMAAGFVGLLLFVRSEMASNRKALADEIHNVVHNETKEVVDQTFGKIEGTFTNLAGTNLTAQAKDAAGTVAGLINVLGGQAMAVLTNGNPASGGSANNVLGNTIQQATEAGRKLNNLALKATELTDEEEMRLGKNLNEQILDEFKELNAPSTLARLNRIAAPIILQSTRKGIQYEIRLVQSDMVNAFSIVGGHIYVTSGLLRVINEDADLAMVLSHEIGHVELRHTAHKVQLAYQGQKVLGDAASLIQPLYDMLSMPYSKVDEYEADEWGFRACKKSGWETDKLLGIFEKLEKIETRSQKVESQSQLEKSIGSYLSSHPTDRERIDRIKVIDASLK